MCKAIEDLINDSKAEGINQGRLEGIALGEERGRNAGRADGIAIGRADGMAAGEARIIIMMHKNGFSAEQIASATSKSVDDVRTILANGEPIPA